MEVRKDFGRGVGFGWEAGEIGVGGIGEADMVRRCGCCLWWVVCVWVLGLMEGQMLAGYFFQGRRVKKLHRFEADSLSLFEYIFKHQFC